MSLSLKTFLKIVDWTRSVSIINLVLPYYHNFYGTIYVAINIYKAKVTSVIYAEHAQDLFSWLQGNFRWKIFWLIVVVLIVAYSKYAFHENDQTFT